LMWVLAGVAVALLAAGDGKPSVSTFTDKRDGKTYKIVRIGGQYWFAENLNYAAAGSVCYDNKAENCAKYGRLYSWETARTACPDGTHLPTDDEWTTLVEDVGGWKTAGEKLKSTAGWNNNGNGTDSYVFSALPGGNGYGEGRFNDVGYKGLWWSVSADYDADDDAWHRIMFNFNECVFRNSAGKWLLFSVRCVLDDEKEAQK